MGCGVWSAVGLYGCQSSPSPPALIGPLPTETRWLLVGWVGLRRQWYSTEIPDFFGDSGRHLSKVTVVGVRLGGEMGSRTGLGRSQEI